MSVHTAMELMGRLLVQAQALSALGAWLRLNGDLERADPAIRPHLERVVAILGAETFNELPEHDRTVVASFTRSYLHQAIELMEAPERPSAWTHDDATILQAQGAASGVVARLIRGAGLGHDDMRVLDVGTGVAGLAISFCREYPACTVVGVDPWEPAVRLARENVRQAGLDGRITILGVPIQSLRGDAGSFDLAWVPSFFIPTGVLDDALRTVRRLLRPGGSVVMGISEQPAEPLARAVDALMTARSGGAVLDADEALARVAAAGFRQVEEIKRTWQAPIRLLSARSG